MQSQIINQLNYIYDNKYYNIELMNLFNFVIINLIYVYMYMYEYNTCIHIHFILNYIILL